MTRLLKYAGAGLIGIAYAVVFAEVFLRLFAPQAIIPRHVTAAPYGVRMNVPSAEYTQVTAETRVSVRINEQGLRSERVYPEEKPAGVTRIALFGDSYFMGYEAELQESFAWQLEQALRARHCPVEVINFAVSGFGTAEMLRTLEEKGLRFAPDLIVFQWHHTDPADNLRAGLYALEEGAVVETGADYIPAVGLREKLFAIPLFRLVSENSQLYAAVRERTAKAVKALLAGKALARPGDLPLLEQPAQVAASPLDVALLDKAAQVTTQAGAAFYVVDIPSVHDRTSFSSGFRLLPPEVRDRPGYITPIAEFRAAARPDQKLYWEKGHYHLTPWGNRLLAETVAARLHAESARQLSCR